VATKKPSTKQVQAPDRNGAQERVLCRLEDISADGGKEVILRDDSAHSLCLVRQNNTVYAYLNACPHTGAPLNWGMDKFLNWDHSLIQCAFHGALFRIGDGLCVWGPCLHHRLTPVPIFVRDGDVVLPDEHKIPLPR
jgi:nitrite reductase/ring-hydroxylating ferredoxin subunit